jgi:hypothetical protein
MIFLLIVETVVRSKYAMGMRSDYRSAREASELEDYAASTTGFKGLYPKLH